MELAGRCISTGAGSAEKAGAKRTTLRRAKPQDKTVEDCNS